MIPFLKAIYKSLGETPWYIKPFVDHAMHENYNVNTGTDLLIDSLTQESADAVCRLHNNLPTVIESIEHLNWCVNFLLAQMPKCPQIDNCDKVLDGDDYCMICRRAQLQEVYKGGRITNVLRW